MTFRNLVGFGMYGLVASALLIGCSGGDDEEDDDDSSDTSPVEVSPALSSIQQSVFTPSCATTNCHDTATASGGLDLTDCKSHGSLVGVKATGLATMNRVTAGDPAASYLIVMLEGKAADVGGSFKAQMPLGGSPLPQETIDSIKQWITAGAAND